jgi:hypothetical protein
MLIFLVLLVLYFLPSIVAETRRVENAAPTIIVNVFFGWTFIGWVVALAMAAGATTKPKARAGEREVDLVAARIFAGTMQPVGDATVIDGVRHAMYADAGLTDRSTFAVARGEDVEVYERRGGSLLIHTKAGTVGWVGAAPLSYRPSPQPAPSTKTCPQCAETIKAAARICRFCRYEFTPTTVDVSG